MSDVRPQRKVSRRRMEVPVTSGTPATVEQVVDMYYDRLRVDYLTPEARAAMVQAISRYSEDELGALKKEIEEQSLFQFPVAAVKRTAEEAEAELILNRVSQELAIEEALTRQLMIRHGL